MKLHFLFSKSCLNFLILHNTVQSCTHCNTSAGQQGCDGKQQQNKYVENVILAIKREKKRHQDHVSLTVIITILS